jgi:hypothetical protein
VGGSLSLREIRVFATVNGDLPAEDPDKLAVIR